MYALFMAKKKILPRAQDSESSMKKGNRDEKIWNEVNSNNDMHIDIEKIFQEYHTQFYAFLHEH